MLQLNVGRIREILKEQGIGRKQLSEKTGLHYMYFSDLYRHKNPKLHTLSKIATAPEVDPAELMHSIDN